MYTCVYGACTELPSTHVIIRSGRLGRERCKSTNANERSVLLCYNACYLGSPAHGRKPVSSNDGAALFRSRKLEETCSVTCCIRCTLFQSLAVVVRVGFSGFFGIFVVITDCSSRFTCFGRVLFINNSDRPTPRRDRKHRQQIK